MKKIYKNGLIIKIIKIIVDSNNNLYNKYYYYSKNVNLLFEHVFLFKQNNVFISLLYK